MVSVKFAAFSNPVGFCFVATETGAGSLGEICVHVSAGGGACCGSGGEPELGGGHGHGVSEDSRKRQKSLGRPCPLGQ